MLNIHMKHELHISLQKLKAHITTNSWFYLWSFILFISVNHWPWRRRSSSLSRRYLLI